MLNLVFFVVFTAVVVLAYLTGKDHGKANCSRTEALRRLLRKR